MLEKMEGMAELVKKNAINVQHRQKKWYDQFARDQQLKSGDQVLVLLPNTTSQLTARWQGSYRVITRIGTVNNLIDFSDRKKKKCVSYKYVQEMAPYL